MSKARKISRQDEQDFWDNNHCIVNGRLVGEIIPAPRKFIPLSRQWPAIFLTRISSYADLLSANYSLLVNEKRQDRIRQRKLTEIAKTLGSDYKVRTELPKEGN